MESNPFSSATSITGSQGSGTASSTSIRPNRRFEGATWSPIDHRANIGRGSKVSSAWLHGGEYINLNDPQGRCRWVCDRCNKSLRLPRSNSTSNVARHLLTAHRIRITDAGGSEEEDEDVIDERHRGTIDQFIKRVDIERFRDLLVRWVVQCQIPFIAVGREQFAKLLLCAQPYLRPYLTSSSTTIRN